MEINAQKQVQWLVLQVIAQGKLLVYNTGLEHKDCGSDYKAVYRNTDALLITETSFLFHRSLFQSY